MSVWKTKGRSCDLSTLNANKEARTFQVEEFQEEQVQSSGVEESWINLRNSKKICKGRLIRNLKGNEEQRLCRTFQTIVTVSAFILSEIVRHWGL